MRIRHVSRRLSRRRAKTANVDRHRSCGNSLDGGPKKPKHARARSVKRSEKSNKNPEPRKKILEGPWPSRPLVPYFEVLRLSYTTTEAEQFVVRNSKRNSPGNETRNEGETKLVSFRCSWPIRCFGVLDYETRNETQTLPRRTLRLPRRTSR